MAERTCHNCVYCCYDPCLWLRLLSIGEPLLPRCANHPWWPGRLHEVPGVPCRKYRPRPVPPAGDDVRMIPLTDGGYAYVDAADYEWLNQWTWSDHGGYAGRFEKTKVIFMHRQIMQAPAGKVVDHIDGNKVNNCRANLRLCTSAENSRNKRKPGGSYSMFHGVSYMKHMKRWYAKCVYEGERIWLGYFDTEADAARAYDRKAVELFGEFARLNFPREWPPERRTQVHAEWQKAEKQRKAQEARERRRKAKGRSSKAKGKSKKREEKRKSERSQRVSKRAESRSGPRSHRQATQGRAKAKLPTSTRQGPARDAKRRTRKTSARAGMRGRGEPKPGVKGKKPEGKKLKGARTAKE